MPIDLERLVRPSQHRDQAAVERQVGHRVSRRCDRGESAFLNAAGKDCDELRVERFVELTDHERRQIRGIGLETDAAGQRQEDLSGVVLLTEEPLIEPRPRAVTIAPRSDGNRDQDDEQARAAAGELDQLLIAMFEQ